MIPTTDYYKTVTDLRENTVALLKAVQKRGEPTIIMHRNKPRAVMLSLKRYNEMLEALEDYYDELLAIELEKEPKENGIPLKKVEEELGIDLNE